MHLADSLTGTDNAEAIAIYKRGVAVREKAGAVTTLGMARNLERLGMMELTEQDFASGEAHLVRALDIEELCGASDDLKFLTMQCLASAYYNNKRYEPSEKICHKINELAGKSPESPTNRSKRNSAFGKLTLICSDTGRRREAMAMSEKLGSMPRPTSEQIKAEQNAYAEMERQVDESEESSFK